MIGLAIKGLGITEKDVKLYFYCVNGNRWWFEGKQKISDIIETGKWPRMSTISQERGFNGCREMYFVFTRDSQPQLRSSVAEPTLV